MLHEHVEFLETSFVQEDGKSFTCSEFAFLVLGVYALLTTAHLCDCAALDQFLDLFLLNAHNDIYFNCVSENIMPFKRNAFRKVSILDGFSKRYAPEVR